MEYIQLNNGNELPAICFGPGIMTRGVHQRSGIFGKIYNKCNKLALEKKYTQAIENAFYAGAQFIDYSATYGREDLIVKAMKHAGVQREKCYLTTRVSNQSQFSGSVRETALRSIERFGTDYIDLLMFHWPVTEHYVSTWKELIKLKEEGYCKNIGVANCHQHHLDTLIQQTGVTPSINQVELHPLFSQKTLLEYCKSRGIVVEAYTSLARMDERMTKLPIMKCIAKKYNKTISQIILRWHIQNGVIPVFRSMNPSRQKENFNVFDFNITEEDMMAIDSININSRLRYDPDNCDFTIL